jgi:hypothetical protein
MKRMRVSTLMLLIVVVALCLGLAVQQRRIARLEDALRNVEDALIVTRHERDTGTRSTGKTPRSARVNAPAAQSTEKRAEDE